MMVLSRSRKQSLEKPAFWMQLYPQIFLNRGTEKLPQQSRLQGLTQRWADTLGKGRQTDENLHVGCHTQTHLRTNHVAEAGRVSHTHRNTQKDVKTHKKPSCLTEHTPTQGGGAARKQTCSRAAKGPTETPVWHQGGPLGRFLEAACEGKGPLC